MGRFGDNDKENLYFKQDWKERYNTPLDGFGLKSITGDLRPPVSRREDTSGLVEALATTTLSGIGRAILDKYLTSSSKAPRFTVTGSAAQTLRRGDIATVKSSDDYYPSSRSDNDRLFSVAIRGDHIIYEQVLKATEKPRVTATRFGIWAVGKSIDTETWNLVDSPDSVVVLRQETHETPLLGDFPTEHAFANSEMTPVTMSIAELAALTTTFDRSHMPTK